LAPFSSLPVIDWNFCNNGLINVHDGYEAGSGNPVWSRGDFEKGKVEGVTLSCNNPFPLFAPTFNLIWGSSWVLSVYHCNSIFLFFFPFDNYLFLRMKLYFQQQRAAGDVTNG